MTGCSAPIQLSRAYAEFEPTRGTKEITNHICLDEVEAILFDIHAGAHIMFTVCPDDMPVSLEEPFTSNARTTARAV